MVINKLWFIKTWQYICDHNSGKSWCIWVFLHIWKREWMPSTSKLFTYFTSEANKYDDCHVHSWAVTGSFAACVARLGAVADCDIVTQLTNGQHASMLLFVSVVDTFNIPCEFQSSVCFLCTGWTFTPRLMQWIIFKECIVKVWMWCFIFTT